MKFRYLKITASVVWGTNELTRDDLARLKRGGYDFILDLENGTQFDAENNSWEKIEGET